MMRIGKYQFSPGLIVTLVTLVLLAILIRLGIWQLDRAEEKRQILATQQAKMAQPVIELTTDIDETDELAFRRIEVSGNFDTRYQLFVDNKIHLGKPGYFVVTPLKLAQNDTYVLVNRGWVPMNPDRKILPNIDTPKGMVTITGLIKTDPKDVADLGSANRSNQGWPAVVRYVDLQQFQQETGLNIQPFLFLLDKNEGHGFVREWKFVNLPPEKSTSYAVTWFSLATLLLIIYLVVNIKKVGKHD
jgi:surfeit locus 1 family protein